MKNFDASFEIDGIGYALNQWGGYSQINPSVIDYNENYLDHYAGFNPSGTNKLNRLKYDFILKHADEFVDTILDFGYGTGSFLDLVAQSSQAYGYDIIDCVDQKEIAWKKVENPFTVKVDCVTLWDVLEHIESFEFLLHLKTKYIAVSLPNCICESIEEFDSWKHRKPDEHLHHFNIDSLKVIMLEHGFELIKFNYEQDEIRKPDEYSCSPNILQALFKKI